MAAAVLLGLTRRPPSGVRLPGWVPILVLAIPVWMAVAGLLVGVGSSRRLVHLALYAALALLLAQGRYDLRAVARGLAWGLLVAVGAGLWGVGRGYTGRLNGFVGDPNAAGLDLVALGAVAMAHLRRGRFRWLFFACALCLIYLTFSRTALLAVGMCALWLTLLRKSRAVVAVGLVGVAIYVIGHIPEDLKVFGPFASRSGSDALRQRILAAERLQLDASPWFGNGPGSSRVLLDGNWFYFHNSYLAARNEAGWIGLTLVLALGVLTLQALVRRPVVLRDTWHEASLVAVGVFAMNLGEVLLDLPTAVVVGVAANALASTRPNRGQT